MAKSTIKHYAHYMSPGTFFHETSERELKAADVKEAAKLAATITERHAAKPFGFQLIERRVHEPIPDGEGGTMKVVPKELQRSGTYFLGGTIRTLDELERENDPKMEILRSNMICNGWPIMLQNDNSWRAFEERDVLLDSEGNVVKRGNAKDLVEYRQKTILRVEAER